MFRTLLLGVAVSICVSPIASAATCTPTGFIRDSINMTAALINPPGTVSSTVDATGCNVAIYVDGGHDLKVQGADVFGSNYFGILVNTDNGGTSNVTIRSSSIHHVGEVPHNGTQHGVGIYLRGFAGSIRGVVDNNWVFDYQKGGIVANGIGTSVDITRNQLYADGHVAFIAQNGIQMAFGSQYNTIADNFVYGNSYIGTGDGSSSAGILLFGGPGAGACPPSNADCDYDLGVVIRGNTLVANDVGIYVYNADASGNPPATATDVTIANNVVYGDACFNQVYQAGITDVGNRDKIRNNTVYGPGYVACATGTTIDVSDANDPQVHNKPHPHHARAIGDVDGN
jgi:prepilin-type processing-associated H-X9-DG protein